MNLIGLNRVSSGMQMLENTLSLSVGDSVSLSPISITRTILLDLLYQQLLSTNPVYMLTIHYTKWYNDNTRIDKRITSEYKNLNYIRRTHKHIINMLNEVYDPDKKGILKFYFFNERCDNNDYHTHFLLTDTPLQLAEKNRKFRRVLKTISSTSSDIKVDIIDSIIRKCKTVQKWSTSLDIQRIYDLYGALDYCTKTISDDTQNMLDVIDFSNSNFNQINNRHY